MLTTSYINDLSTKRVSIFALAITVSVAAILAYFAAFALWRDSLVDATKRDMGETAADFLPVAMILPAFAILLVPVIWAERRANRYAVICPECNADVSRYVRRVIATRCCGSCGKQIVEGRRIRSRKAFERLSQIKQRRFLIYWFWAWPILGLLILGYRWIAPTALSNCPHMVFIPGLVGTTAAGWAFARTMDKRCIPQLGASAIVFCLGVNALW